MGIKPLIIRLPVMLLGYFAAGLAAGSILIPAYLWTLVPVGIFAPAIVPIAWLSLYGFSIYVGVLILPVLVVAAITEVFRVRRLMPYLLLGAVCLLLWASYLFGPARLVRDNPVAAIIIPGAGVIAGLVYWSIAGRNAGAGSTA
ncbi:hypothetical protein [Bradyrhizobium sp.]|uniref:hypothetical protein n=1 Tax=Bradyrhizobium sp. TaxID=376 RepID=UPI003C50965F